MTVLRVHRLWFESLGTLSKEWALESMKELLLVNMRGNLQIVVQVSCSRSACSREHSPDDAIRF